MWEFLLCELQAAVRPSYISECESLAGWLGVYMSLPAEERHYPVLTKTQLDFAAAIMDLPAVSVRMVLTHLHFSAN